MDNRVLLLEDKESFSTSPDFWSDSSKAELVMKEIKTHKKYLGEFENIKLLVEDAEVLFDFQKEGEATEDEVEAKYQEAILAFEDLEFHRTLNRPEDELGVILEINAGAGGTEACDWAEMIFRMYVRWAERSGFKVTALSEVQGDVAGIKSAEIEINSYHS